MKFGGLFDYAWQQLTIYSDTIRFLTAPAASLPRSPRDEDRAGFVKTEKRGLGLLYNMTYERYEKIRVGTKKKQNNTIDRNNPRLPTGAARTTKQSVGDASSTSTPSQPICLLLPRPRR